MGKVIGEKENKILTEEIKETEDWEIIKNMELGKCPGIDGLSVEFYQEMWGSIRDEFLKVIKYVFQEMICGTVNKGVVTFTPKNGSLDCIKSWRPITMLYIDY